MLSPNKWHEFFRRRCQYRSESVPCPWCDATGTLRDGRGYEERCVACMTRGSIDSWLALHRPVDNGYGDNIPYLIEAEELMRRDKWFRSSIGFELVPCPECAGTGRVGNNYACRTCNWVGKMTALEAAIYVTVPCPQCNAAGVGGSPGMSWACGYCSMTGRISVDRLEPWTMVSVGETHSLYLNMEDAVRDGNFDALNMWSSEFNAREEAMPGVRWSGIEFGSSDLSDLDLSHASLSGCELQQVARTRFVGADMTNVRLRDGDARDADFTDADLSNADLSDTNFLGSTLHLAASLKGAKLERATGLSSEQLIAIASKGAHGVTFPRFRQYGISHAATERAN